ncbi:MAG: LegC family aminotransferase [Pedobacter sp.]|nr:MAG: LegC family aminotransferase [Pedobacter sp.]
MIHGNKFQALIDFIKIQYPNKRFIGLHEPVFIGNERKYVIDAIDSTYVSSVGAYVNKFEEMVCEITGAAYSVAIVNGTSALHMALLLADVQKGEEVISQSLTFIATCNAISYIGASPLFLDVDRDSLGLSPYSLKNYLEKNAEIKSNGYTYNKKTGRKIKACIPMHTFGLPCRIDEIADICSEWNITLIEDAAESLGSYYKGKHTGVFGKIGIFSLNGNKTVTSGGGGALVTNDETIARKAKHLTTQAKVPHKWEFNHDAIGYNYRMPNINAALAFAQLEQLKIFIEDKRKLAELYHAILNTLNIDSCKEIPGAEANYWLNTILLNNKNERDDFLTYMNNNGVMSRPVWTLMHHLPMFKKEQRGSLDNSEWLADRLVNIPSSVRL